MRAYIVKTGSSSLDSLVMVERPKPTPGRGEVLIKVGAASLNFRDQAIVSGKYFLGAVKRDTIPLSDGAGVIEAVGEGVSRLSPGDRVAGCFFQNWYDGKPPQWPPLALGSPADGMLADYVVLAEDGVVKLPDHLSIEEGATLPCAGLTAWHALVERTNKLRPGGTVLCLGTGGVSIFALQFAHLAGSRVIITSSSDDKLARAKAMGASDGVNYRETPDWDAEVLKLTGGAGVDNIVEVGGAGTLPKSYNAIGYGGQISLIGVLARAESAGTPHALMLKAARLEGIFVGNRAMFERMNAAIALSGLKPVIDKVFGFEEAADAYRYQLSGKHFGKIVIKVGG